MSNSAPFCNVKLVQEKGSPAAATRIQRIPPNASLTQVINIVNNNFNALIRGNYVENHRASQIVRIYNPQDPTQYVDVRQITGLQFINPLTGQTMTFRR